MQNTANVYDELSDVESEILKLSEQRKNNYQIASILNLSYDKICSMKLAMRKRGIYIHNMGTREDRLTEEVKARIIKMDSEGAKNSDICGALGVKGCTLQFFKRKMKKDGVEFQSRAGRPAPTTDLPVRFVPTTPTVNNN